MRRIDVTRGLVAAVLCLGTAAAADATTVVHLSDAEMVQESDLIVTGRCAGVRTEWIGRDLVTLATIEVDEALKGDPGATVEVALPGGVDADRRFPVAVTWPGAPRIETGEEVFLFLVGDEALERPVVTGFAQGKFTLIEDETGARVAAQSLGGLTLVGDRTGRKAGGARAVPVAELRETVRRHLAADRARR